jgi:hypothetical protein
MQLLEDIFVALLADKEDPKVYEEAFNGANPPERRENHLHQRTLQYSSPAQLCLSHHCYHFTAI